MSDFYCPLNCFRKENEYEGCFPIHCIKLEAFNIGKDFVMNQVETILLDGEPTEIGRKITIDRIKEEVLNK